MEMVDEGFIDDETAIFDTLEGIDGAFEDKIDNIACVIKSYGSEAKAIRNEIDKLLERATSCEKRVKWLKSYVKQAMQAVGTKKVQSARNVVTVRKAPDSVVIEGISVLNIDDCYLRYKDPEFNKAAIKEALQAGIAIKGCTLKTDNVSLVVK